jgi:hypothetical protein
MGATGLLLISFLLPYPIWDGCHQRPKELSQHLFHDKRVYLKVETEFPDAYYLRIVEGITSNLSARLVDAGVFKELSNSPETADFYINIIVKDANIYGQYKEDPNWKNVPSYDTRINVKVTDVKNNKVLTDYNVKKHDHLDALSEYFSTYIVWNLKGD